MGINTIGLEELNSLIDKRNPSLVKKKLEEIFGQKIEKDTNLDELFREKIFGFLLVNLGISKDDFKEFTNEEKQEYIEGEIESLKQQLKKKEDKITELKKITQSEKTDEARKMLASAIREKKGIKEKLENVRLSWEIFNKLELVKQELISVFETKKIETKIRIIKPVETKKEPKQVKIKDTTKIEESKKEKKISLKDFENILEEGEQEVKGFLEKNYDRFSDNDKVVICEKLLDNKYSIEYVGSLFKKIKVSKLTKTFSNKWMDIDGKIEEIKKERRKKELLDLEENEIKAKLDNLGIEYTDDLDKEKLVKLLLKNEGVSKPQKNKKTVKKKVKAVSKIKPVSDDSELSAIIPADTTINPFGDIKKVEIEKPKDNLVCSNELDILKNYSTIPVEDIDIFEFTNFYKAIFDKTYRNKDGRVVSIRYTYYIRNVLEKIFSDEKKGEELLFQLKENCLFTKHERFFFVSYYPKLDFIIENTGLDGKSEILGLVDRMLENESKYYNKILELLGKLKNIFDNEGIDSYFPKKNEFLKEKLEGISNKSKNKDILLEIQKIRDMFGMKSILEEENVSFENGTYHMVKEVVTEQLIPEPEEVKEEIILEPIEEEKPVSELDIEENKQETKNYQNIEQIRIDFESMNKFLFIRKLNEQYDSLDDNLKLEICLFLNENNYKSEFIKKYFDKIDETEIDDKLSYNKLKKYLLESREKKIIIVNSTREQDNDFIVNEEVQKLFDKYMEGNIRGRGAKEKIEKLLSRINVEMLITIILKDLNLFFQKKGYYFELLREKVEEYRDNIIKLKGSEWFDKVICSIERRTNCFELNEKDIEFISAEMAREAFGASVVAVPIKRDKLRTNRGPRASKGKILKGKEALVSKIQTMFRIYLNKYLREEFTELTKKAWLDFVRENKDNDIFWNMLQEELGESENIARLLKEDFEKNGIEFKLEINEEKKGGINLLEGFTEEELDVFDEVSVRGFNVEEDEINTKLSKREVNKEKLLKEKIERISNIESLEELIEYYKKELQNMNNYRNRADYEKYLLSFIEKFDELKEQYVGELKSKYRVVLYLRTLEKRINELKGGYSLPKELLKEYKSRNSNEKKDNNPVVEIKSKEELEVFIKDLREGKYNGEIRLFIGNLEEDSKSSLEIVGDVELGRSKANENNLDLGNEINKILAFEKLEDLIVYYSSIKLNFNNYVFKKGARDFFMAFIAKFNELKDQYKGETKNKYRVAMYLSTLEKRIQKLDPSFKIDEELKAFYSSKKRKKGLNRRKTRFGVMLPPDEKKELMDRIFSSTEVNSKDNEKNIDEQQKLKKIILNNLGLKGKSPSGKTWYEEGLTKLFDYKKSYDLDDNFIELLFSKLKVNDILSLYEEGFFPDKFEVYEKIFYLVTDSSKRILVDREKYFDLIEKLKNLLLKGYDSSDKKKSYSKVAYKKIILTRFSYFKNTN